MKSKQYFSLLDMAMVSMFVGVVSICAWITILLPVPFTMQVFGVYTAVGVLGVRKGSLCVFVYLLLGLVGVPVFSGFQGGIAYLFGSTGGFLLGFLPASVVTGFLIRKGKNSVLSLSVSMGIGQLICYLFGTMWFAFVYTQGNSGMGLWAAFMQCVIPFIIPDIFKIILAALLTLRIKRYMGEN